jgi:ElaB/YqjD/DUF883 family membrane-anchored ribosome-binding protein
MNENPTNDKLASDMKVVISDAEDLLKATASAAGERVTAARARMEESLRVAKVKLADAQEAVVGRAKDAALATDDYVHAHPWQSAGIGLAVGLILGILIARR